MEAQQAAPAPEGVGAVINLPEEFRNANCLSIAEVSFLLDGIRERDAEWDPSEIFKKTQQYAQVFSQTTRVASEEVRALLNARDLQEFERAQLVNLAPETTEEAKVLVPSLERFDEDALQQILGDLAALKRFAK
ncbi:putative DNA-directed RNA polymerase II subunit RPB4 [Paratrimastix pyriformis]|uniref:DNA-directed RNA polymerase II subunit RPB4 n=1 Tax=Paratrimastix pyriformis TaxID=342808 RepID=A0ABQ8UMJ1_9EUKA|nr:putative DNA-directed RNA polymerase II subunit RPB4 [Paratrimastix pyriformis]